MARICKICARKPNFANSRSKSNVATKRTQKPNLQKLKIGNASTLACTRCMRTMNKESK